MLSICGVSYCYFPTLPGSSFCLNHQPGKLFKEPKPKPEPKKAPLESELKKTDLGNDKPLNKDLLDQLCKMPVYGEVIRMIVAQQEKGLEKYGQLLKLDNYTIEEWIEHGQMECIDKMIYLEGIKQKIKALKGAL